MKVVHLVTQMEAGGAQGAAVRLHQRMLACGVESSVVFLYRKRDVYQGVQNCQSLWPASPTNPWQFLLILWRLFRLLRKQRDASLMCYTHYANVVGALVGRLAAVRRIVVSHRSLLDCYPNIVIKLDKWLGTLGFYDAMICVSGAVMREFSAYPQRYQARLRLIYNGIEVPSLSTTGRYDWVQNPAFLNLVTAGRLHEQKNHQVLFEAVRRQPKLRLIIAGEGHLRPVYEAYIRQHQLEKRLILLGEIPPAEVTEFISKGDIFVFPSQTEAFGFSLIEAMSIGLPVITSDIESMKEIGQGELLALPCHDENAWAQELAASFNRERLARMSETSIRVAKFYEFSQMYQAYWQVLNDD